VTVGFFSLHQYVQNGPEGLLAFCSVTSGCFTTAWSLSFSSIWCRAELWISESKSFHNWRSVGQSVHLGVEPHVGLTTLIKICGVWPLRLYLSGGALSDEGDGSFS